MTHIITPNLLNRFHNMHYDVLASNYSYILLQWDVCQQVSLPHECINSTDVIAKFAAIPHKKKHWQWDACDSSYLYWFMIHRPSFNKYWIVEYDVVWTGYPSEFFRIIDRTYPHTDFVGPYVNTHNTSSWYHINKVVGDNSVQWKSSLVQMIRISRESMSKTVDQIANNHNWRYCEAQILRYSRDHISWFPEYSGFFGTFSWNTFVTNLPESNITRFYHREKTGKLGMHAIQTHVRDRQRKIVNS